MSYTSLCILYITGSHKLFLQQIKWLPDQPTTFMKIINCICKKTWHEGIWKQSQIIKTCFPPHCTKFCFVCLLEIHEYLIHGDLTNNLWKAHNVNTTKVFGQQQKARVIRHLTRQKYEFDPKSSLHSSSALLGDPENVAMKWKIDQ